MSDEMPKAIVALRVVRPYDSEEQFLENEAFALTRTSLVLVGASSRPEGVILRFELVLRSGAILLRGEGRVISHGPTPLGESGLTLKFTRLDPRSKALVDRAGMSRVVEAPAPSEAPPSVAPRSTRESPRSEHPSAKDEERSPKVEAKIADLPPSSPDVMTARPTVPTMQAVEWPVVVAGQIPPAPPTSAGPLSLRDAALERLRARLKDKDAGMLLSTLNGRDKA